MTEREKQFEFNQDKFALLDTNTLKALLDGTKEAKRFYEVLDFLKVNKIHPYIIHRITDFEFVGFSTNKKSYDQLNAWISNNFDGLPPMPEDFEMAKKLSAMYKCKNPSISPKQISFVDCLYAAQLARFPNRAFIVTTDLNDYPTFLFDMPKHFAIEDKGGATSFVGLKVFNTKKFQALEENFNKSG